MKQSKGFMLGYTMLVGALVLIVIVAIVHLLSSRQATTLHIKYSNKAFYLADSGIQHALSQIRQNATSTEGLEDIDVVIEQSDPRFEYRYKVELSTITLPQFYEQLIVSATSYGVVTLKHLNKKTTKYVHVLIQVNTLSDYFEISTKTLKIGRGLDISNADIYGYNLVFLDDDSGRTTKVNKADYFNSAQNDTQGWVEIGDVPGGGANKLGMKIDLPRLSETIFMYKDLARTTNYMQGIMNSTGLLGESNCTNNYTATISGDIYPPINGNGIYYFSGPIVIGDPNFQTTIHGQIVFVTTETITIKGDLIKSFDGRNHIDSDDDEHIDEFDSWDPAYAVTFASIPVPTSLLGLISGSDINVEKTDVSNIAQSIEIETLIMASEGSFTTAPNVLLNGNAVFKFLGAIMIREGISFSHIYTDPANREYNYDEDLREYGLPHMPYLANIIYYHSG